MSDKLNIDELLKQELGNLAPEPPAGVWQNVNSQVQASAQAAHASGQAMNGVASAAKTITLGSKIILASATLVATAGVFLGYRLLTKQEPKAEHAVVAAQPIETAEPGTAVNAENESTDKEAPTLTSPQQLNPTSTTTFARPASHGKKQAGQNHVNSYNNTVQPVNTPKEPLQDHNHPVQNATPVNATTASRPEQVISPEAARKQQNEVADNRTNEAMEDFAEPSIPNVFTPNNDGANDEFVITIENEILFDLKITDAKGGIVFESADKNKHWNGTNMFTGKSCEAGTYVLAFRYQLKGMKSSRFKTGTIKLLQ